jgi:undecaprenyl-diphosphatase
MVSRRFRRAATRAALAAGVAGGASKALRPGPVRVAVVAAVAAGAAMEGGTAGDTAARTALVAPGLAAMAAPPGKRREVLAAATTGVAAALVTRRWMPVAPEEAIGPARAGSGRRPPRPDGAGVRIVVNPGSGPALSANPAGALRAELPAAEVIELSPDDDPVEVFEKAADGAEVLGVAGGDGTVRTAAGVAMAHDLPLLVVPAGTLNHFARDLGLHTVADSIAALRGGRVARIDVGVVDGQPFLNTFSIGAYVELVDARERLERRIGKWPAVLVALGTVLRANQPLEVEVDGVHRRVWLLFAGNCCYKPAGFAPSWREDLDDGLLDVRLVDAGHPGARLRLLAAVLTGTLASAAPYKAWAAERVEVRVDGLHTRIACDGETGDGPGYFELTKRRRGLEVYAPLD